MGDYEMDHIFELFHSEYGEDLLDIDTNTLQF